MKVDIVCFTGDSGLTDYSVSLARSLTSLCQTSLITSTSIADNFRKFGFSVFTPFRRSRHYFFDIFKFFFLIASRKPDWLIFQGPLKFPIIDALVVYFLRLIGVKSLVTVHDVLPHYPKWWSKYEYGFYYRAFDKVIVHSDYSSRSVKNLGVKSPMLCVPHGIYDIFNINRLSRCEAVSNIKKLQLEDFSILFFGHLEPRKGFCEFVDAAIAMKNSTDIKFLVAGASSNANHGPAYQDKLNYAQQADNVILDNFRIPFEDVENYFSACDVVALPYLEGTTSGVLKLALAFGKPVIITKVGDLPEELPNSAGIVIDNDENLVEALCDAIIELKLNYTRYDSAMKSAADLAQWPDISKKVYSFLSK